MSTPDSNQPPHSDYDEKVSVVSEHAAAAAREKPDPRDGNEPVPLWGFLIVSVAMFVGAAYWGGANGGLSNASYTYSEDYSIPERPGDDMGSALDPATAWIKEGKKHYGSICSACHQADGKGQAGVYPPLANSEYVYEGSERLAMILLNGVQGPITVDGKSYNSLMAPWKDALNDKQMAQLMSYLRTTWGNAEKLAEGDNGFVSEEMVKKARATHDIPGLKVPDLEGFNKNLEGPQLDFGAPAPQ